MRLDLLGTVDSSPRCAPFGMTCVLAESGNDMGLSREREWHVHEQNAAL